MFLGLFVVGLGLAAILIYNTTLQGVGVWLSLSCGKIIMGTTIMYQSGCIGRFDCRVLIN